jgi:hypothetical protein
VATVLNRVGGVAIVLRIIADATTVEYLRDAVELFVLCIKHSTANAREAERINAYAILGGLLGCKGDILSRETIDFVISLTWKEVGTPHVCPACRHLLERVVCDSVRRTVALSV